MNRSLNWLAASLSALLFSAQSHAYVISSVRTDMPVPDAFSIDLNQFGYDPSVDFINSTRVSLTFREIDDDSDVDNPDSGTNEFVVIYSMLWGERLTVIPDMDNETLSFFRAYTPGEDTCVNYGEVDCVYDPVKSGLFGFGIDADSNLWLEEERWEFDITRAEVSEPPLWTLLLPGLLALRLQRRRQSLAPAPH